jgi:O-antigen/teichoic acid export membrane protein
MNKRGVAAAESVAATDLLDTPQAGPAAIRGSLLRASGYLAGVSLSILSVSLLIRHLGVGDFGRYVTVLSLVAIVQGVTDAGLSSIGVREYSLRSGAARDRLMSSLLGVRLVLTSIGVVVITGFTLLAGYGAPVVVGSALAGAGLLLAVAQATLAIPLASLLRLGLVSGLDLFRQVLLVIGIVVLVLVGADLVPFLALTVPIGVLLLAVTAALVRGSMPMRPVFHRGEWWALVRDVLPYAAAVAIGTIYLRITVVAMSLIATELETGYYATAYRVMEVLVAIPPLVVGSTLPVLARAARDDRERLEYVLQRLLDATVIVGVWLGLAVALGAPFAVEVLAGGESDPSIDVLRVQAIAIVAAFVAASAQFGLLSLHRHRAILAYSVAALVSGLSLTLLLVPTLEATGAAIAFSAGEWIVTILAFTLLRRAQPQLRYSLRVPLRAVAAAAVAGALALLPGLSSLLSAIVATVVFFALLFALRAIPQELIEALSRRGQTATPQDPA